MEKYLITLLAVGIAILIVGATVSVYQLYRLVVADAKCRGIKCPRFWGLLASSGNNQSGIILYLIKRRNYPIQSMSDTEKVYIEKCKKKIGVGLIFLVLGGIACVWGIFLI